MRMPRTIIVGFLSVTVWHLPTSGTEQPHTARAGPAPAIGVRELHRIDIIPNEVFQRSFLEVLKTYNSAPEHLRALATLLEESKLIRPDRPWRNDDQMQQAVVEQIFLCLVNNGYAVRRDWVDVFAVGAAYHLNIGPESFARALMPYVAYVDPEIRTLAIDLLEGGGVFRIEDGSFRHVTDYLRRIGIDGDPDQVHPRLWHILYERSPPAGLHTAVAVLLPASSKAPMSDPDVRQRDDERKRIFRYVAYIEYASGIFSVVRPGEVIASPSPDPVAFELLGELSGSEYWFVRMYVAAVMGKSPTFKSPPYFHEERARRLAEDEHPAVRMMMEGVLRRREEQREKGVRD